MATVTPVLGPVGITHAEEAVYQALLDRPRTSSRALTEIVSLPSRQVGRLLASLEAKGLVSRLPGKPVRFMPAPPAAAVEVLILRRQEEIERVRTAVSDLARRFRAAAQQTPSPLEVVEVIEGREGVVERFVQLQESATEEILAFDKPPYAVGVHEDNIPLEISVLARGVRSRTVYDQAAVEHPGMFEHIERVAAAGEEARVFTPVPMKLVLADRRLALVPLWLDEPEVRGTLVVHPSPLLEALAILFELLWERAVPIGAGVSGGAARPAGLTADELRVLTMLAAGLKDQAIARRMDVALSTVARRVRRIMQVLDAQSRFQAGLQAARGGWLADAGEERSHVPALAPTQPRAR